MPMQKSVVLVTVDCLRADHCGFMGYSRPTTPFLDGLAGESLVFPAAIVAGVPTYYSFPAIMASRNPLALGREIIGLATEEKSMASIFKESGYATAFVGAGNPYLSARFGYNFGFDTFRDFLDNLNPNPVSDRNPVSGGGWARNLNEVLSRTSHKLPVLGAAYDEFYFRYCQFRSAPARSLDTLRRFPAADVVVDHARTWLASGGQNPFFLWLHLMDPHSPYYPTETGVKSFSQNSLAPARAQYLNAYWKRFDVGNRRLQRYRDQVIALYDSGIRWVDAQLSRLVQVLRQFKLWDDCIFVVTADHGEEFMEHDRRYHAPALAEELIHVPLLFRVPGTRKKVVSGNPFSLLHLAPTLLAAAGLPVPREFQGQNHWKHIQEGGSWDEHAISECIAGCTNPFSPEQRRGARLLSVRERRYKLVLNFESRAEYLYDLETDPREQAPLSNAAAKSERQRLLQAALAHLRRSGSRQPSQAYLRTRLRDFALNPATATTASSTAIG